MCGHCFLLIIFGRYARRGPLGKQEGVGRHKPPTITACGRAGCRVDAGGEEGGVTHESSLETKKRKTKIKNMQSPAYSPTTVGLSSFEFPFSGIALRVSECLSLLSHVLLSGVRA